MAKVREIAHTYDTGDIYNMDETGLFWKMMPSRGLSSQNYLELRKTRSESALHSASPVLALTASLFGLLAGTRHHAHAGISMWKAWEVCVSITRDRE